MGIEGKDEENVGNNNCLTVMLPSSSSAAAASRQKEGTSSSSHQRSSGRYNQSSSSSSSSRLQRAASVSSKQDTQIEQLSSERNPPEPNESSKNNISPLNSFSFSNASNHKEETNYLVSILPVRSGSTLNDNNNNSFSSSSNNHDAAAVDAARDFSSSSHHTESNLVATEQERHSSLKVDDQGVLVRSNSTPTSRRSKTYKKKSSSKRRAHSSSSSHSRHRRRSSSKHSTNLEPGSAGAPPSVIIAVRKNSKTPRDGEEDDSSEQPAKMDSLEAAAAALSPTSPLHVPASATEHLLEARGPSRLRQVSKQRYRQTTLSLSPPNVDKEDITSKTYKTKVSSFLFSDEDKNNNMAKEDEEIGDGRTKVSHQPTLRDPSDPDPSRLALASSMSMLFRDPRSKRRTLVGVVAVCILLLLVVMAVFLPVLGFGSWKKDRGDPNTPALAPTAPDPPSLGWSPEPTYAPTRSLLADADLYCFPPTEDRLEFSLWSYTLQVKHAEMGGLCGPENNRFARSTVKVGRSSLGGGGETIPDGSVFHSDSDDSVLTLQYTQRTGSEVRIILPDGQQFSYGSFSFSVKSVTVYDIHRNVLSNTLPKELVLGLFTWDDKEAYLTYENYHHEVDIEISRWNQVKNADVQFLVQQPGKPETYRFYSGVGETYNQGGHWYNFTWLPGEIEWSSDAGVGHRVKLTTEKAVRRDYVDYIQCLPGKLVDVRMNLWNVNGAQTPEGLGTYDSVEVVIDKFEFKPSTLTHVPQGGYCSKDCQCAEGFHCVGGSCEPQQYDPNWIPPVINPPPSIPYYCGCSSCHQEMWDKPAPTLYQTCGERIIWLQEAFPDEYPRQVDACRAISQELPCICGMCHPLLCDSVPDRFSSCLASATPSPPPVPRPSPTATARPTLTQAPTGDLYSTNLYCFPNVPDRTKYTLWNRKIVQVKGKPVGLCGPMNNRFSDTTVSVLPTGALRMLFTQGTASEVRILLPEDELPFGYGEYSFSIQSITVRATDGAIISRTLPKDLVFAMFTWEETNDEETYNHEIAVRLSRAGLDDGPDLLFSVQPSGHLRSYRSFSGTGETYSQGGNWYNISWLPGEISWSTNAGGGQSASVTSELAFLSNEPDHIRCP